MRGGALVRWAFRAGQPEAAGPLCGPHRRAGRAVVAFCFWLDPSVPGALHDVRQGEAGSAGPGHKQAGSAGGYFSRLWNQFSGTYYLPNIRVQLVLFCLAAVLAGFFALVMHREQPGPAAQALSLLAGAGGLCAAWC